MEQIIKEGNGKLRLIVDLDDTISDFIPKWLEYYNKETNSNIKCSDIKKWDILSTDGIGSSIFDVLKRNPQIYGEVELKECCFEVFKKLYDVFDVYIVSSCTPETVKIKADWIKRKLPFFDIRRFVACHPKFIINTDIIIDDRVENLDCSNAKHKILMDCSHNKNYGKDYFRAYHWNDLYAYMYIHNLPQSQY